MQLTNNEREQMGIDKKLKNLIETLNHDDPDQVYLACETLEKMGILASPASPTLINLISEADSWRVRRAAIRVLKNTTETRSEKLVTALVTVAISDASVWPRSAACDALKTFITLATERQLTLSLLKNQTTQLTDPNAKKNLLTTVVRLDLIPDFLEELAVYLTDNDPDLREQAAKSLGFFDGILPEKLISCLEKATYDEMSLVREAAIETLGRIGPERIKDRLIDLLDDSISSVRVTALEALGELNEQRASRIVLSAITKMLTDRSEAVRVTAASTLDNLTGGDNSQLAPSLLKLLSGHSWNATNAATKLIQSKQKRDPIKLGSSNPPLTTKAVEAESELEDFVKDIHLLTPKLVHGAVYDYSAVVRESSLWLLSKIRTSVPQVQEEICFITQNKQLIYRKRALALMSNLPINTRAAIPILEGTLKDSSSTIRKLSLQALTNMGKQAVPAIPDILRRAFEGDDDITKTARPLLTELEKSLTETHRPWFKEFIKYQKPSLEIIETLLISILTNQTLPARLLRDFETVCQSRTTWHNKLIEKRGLDSERLLNNSPLSDSIILRKYTPKEDPFSAAFLAAKTATASKWPRNKTTQREQELRIRAAAQEYAWLVAKLLKMMENYSTL